MKRAWTAVVVLALLAGCSSAAKIAQNANVIKDEAAALVKHGTETGDPVVVASATKISDAAGKIHEELAGVEDKTSPLMSTLYVWGIAAACVAVAIIVWKSGVGDIVRVAVGWLPRRKVSEAEMAADVLDNAKPEGVREYVAARRASDPLFDAAYRRAAARHKKKQT